MKVRVNEQKFASLSEQERAWITRDHELASAAVGDTLIVGGSLTVDGAPHHVVRARVRGRRFSVPVEITDQVLSEDVPAGLVDAVQGAHESGLSRSRVVAMVREIFATLGVVLIAVTTGCSMVDVESHLVLPPHSESLEALSERESPLVWVDVTSVAGSTEDVPAIIDAGAGARTP